MYAPELRGKKTVPPIPAAVIAELIAHLCDLSWNQIVPSLSVMHNKLVELGFEYYNGKIVINEIETEGSNYHVK